MATKRSTKTVLVLRWVARTFGTIIAVFTLTRFAVEILEPGGLNIENPWHWVLLVPMWIASFALLFALRWEKIGALVATLFSLFIALASLPILQTAAGLIIAVAYLIPAVLFLYCSRASKKLLPPEPTETAEVHHEPA